MLKISMMMIMMQVNAELKYPLQPRVVLSLQPWVVDLLQLARSRILLWNKRSQQYVVIVGMINDHCQFVSVNKVPKSLVLVLFLVLLQYLSRVLKSFIYSKKHPNVISIFNRECICRQHKQ